MLYVEIKESEEKDFIKRWDKNMENIKNIDEEVKKNNTLLHRFIYQPYADGNAVYQIIKVNKKTVRIRVCTGIGDDWIIPYWGEETLIDKAYAEESIYRRDYLDSLFKGKSVVND